MTDQHLPDRMTAPTALGDILRRALARHGLSARDLAKTMNRGHTSISYLMNGGRRFDWQTVHEVAVAVEIYDGWADSKDLLELWRLSTAHHGGESIPQRAVNAVYLTLLNTFTRQPPSHLPRDIVDFTNRTDELTKVSGFVADGWQFIVLTGMGGVGKSKLAVHLAQRFGADWPHHHLYLKMQDRDGTTLDAVAAMAALLDQIGDATDDDIIDLKTRWHTALRGTRSLLVLDDVAEFDQIKALLPANGQHLVIITSRSGIAFEHAKVVRIGTFTDEAALQLLLHISGTPDSSRLAPLLDTGRGLPIALRAIGTRIQLGTSPESLVVALRDEKTRLQTLSIGSEEIDVLACLSFSYRALDPDRQRRFRLLSAIPGADFGLEVAAAVLEMPESAATLELDIFVTASIIEPASPGRFALHDLYRTLARQVAEQDAAPGDTRAAAVRAVRWYTEQVRDLGADQARDGVPDVSSLPWRDREGANAFAAAAVGLELEEWQSVFDLSRELHGYYTYRGKLEEAEAVMRYGLIAARSLGEVSPLIDSCVTLAVHLSDRGRNHDAIRLLLPLLELNMTDRNRSWVLAHLGAQQRDSGDYVAAITNLTGALELARSCGERRHTAWVLGYLGLTYEVAGLHEQALEAETEAERIYRDADDLDGLIWIVVYKSRTFLGLNRVNEAEDSLLWALSAVGSVNNLGTEAWVWTRLCYLYRDHGSWAKLGDAAKQLERVGALRENKHIVGEAVELRALAARQLSADRNDEDSATTQREHREL